MGVLMNVLFYFGGSLVLLVLVLWLLATVYLYVVHRRYAHLPSPKGRSFYMGHLPTMAKFKKSGLVTGKMFLEWSKECGSLYAIFFLHVPAVVALKAEDIRELLMNVRAPKATASYKVLSKPYGERFLGHGLLTVQDYDSWRPRRSLYDPSFTRSYLKSLVPSFNECVDQFLERLKIAVRGERKVLMRKEFGYVTLQVIGKVAFGSDFSQPRSNKALGLKYIQGDGTLNFHIDHTFKGLEIALRQPLYWLFHPILTEGYRETIRAIRKIGQECIMKRYKAIENEEEVPNDILTQIIRVATTERRVDLEDLVDDFATFYIAGQETTSLLLTFTLITLNQHPEVKQRVLDEISEVLGERNYVTSEDIDQLQYMEQVFQEMLRLYPPASGTARESPSDDFKLSGYSIPKGTWIIMNFYTNQHNPEHWEDPEMFDPSRFDPDRGKPNPFIYSPFSVGYRSCIGKVFAMMEAKIIMARLLNSFKIDLEEGYQLKLVQTTTLKPADDVPCTVVPLK